MLSAAYGRYRAWASRFDPRASTAIGSAFAMVGLALVSVKGSTWALWSFLPWLAAVGGPLAAIDAYGAAAHRGVPSHGIARAIFLLAISWGFAGYAMFGRAE